MNDEPMAELVEVFVWKFFDGCLPQEVSPGRLAWRIVDVLQDHIEVDEVAGLDVPLSVWEKQAWEYFQKRLVGAIEARLEVQSCQYLESPSPN